jgi:hypothetical protein
MATTTESRFVLSARCILADVAGLLPAVERNPLAAADLQVHLQTLMQMVDETMPKGSQLDPFEPIIEAAPYAASLVPPTGD